MQYSQQSDTAFNISNLYQILRKKRYGCWVKDHYYGILGYSDDVLLIAPSINALKEMTKTCESYAKKHNLHFRTNSNSCEVYMAVSLACTSVGWKRWKTITHSCYFIREKAGFSYLSPK